MAAAQAAAQQAAQQQQNPFANLLGLPPLNLFRRSAPLLVDGIGDENVLHVEKRKLADALGITVVVRNLDAIIAGLGGVDAPSSLLVRRRKAAILEKFDNVFADYVRRVKNLVQNYATIAEARESAYSAAKAAMDADMQEIDRMFPERTEEIDKARTLARRRADIY
jgi:DNA-binding Lrp family transcriptional regulator